MEAQTLQPLLATLCLLSVLGVAVVVTMTAGAAGLGAYAVVVTRSRHIFKAVVAGQTGRRLPRSRKKGGSA